MRLGKDTTKKLGTKQPKELGRSRAAKKAAQKTAGGGWDEAIKDAERKIDQAKVRLARLKAALSFCRESLASGDPFPGDL